MVQRELYSDLRAIPPVFLRLDGRSFHRLSQRLEFTRPFDERFSHVMARVSESLIVEAGLQATFAYTFSDEISLYIPRLPFGGRVEKMDSVSAAFAASALTVILSLAEPVAFDARIVQVGGEATFEYLVQRQQEAWRNHMNAYGQQALIDEGMHPADAAAALKGLSSGGLHEMMFARGINLAKTPAWQRRGVLVRKTGEERTGYNPLSGEVVVVAGRTRLEEDRDLPMFTSPEGVTYLHSLIEA
ncbi:MAG: tRNA 5'-guanylyltransferase [Methanomicrobiales archaeon]|nr:tRNA 5'-guanylyltransferase [Methanomicrobiales archaeon]